MESAPFVHVILAVNGTKRDGSQKRQGQVPCGIQPCQASGQSSSRISDCRGGFRRSMSDERPRSVRAHLQPDLPWPGKPQNVLNRSLYTPSFESSWLTVPAVESRKGAWPEPTGQPTVSLPAHQTGQARLEHPAFRQTSPTTHGSRPICTCRNRNTPSRPNTIASEKLVVPREDTRWRCRRKCHTRS
jgi:hypothetical protein